jgi:hypothetical protein
MPTDWKAFVSGFGDSYGKPAAIIVFVLCLFFAFGPTEWITGWLALPWSDASLAITRAIFLVIGGGAAVVLWRYFHKPSAAPDQASPPSDRQEPL